MTPFSELRELITQLQHPAVRDLAWTLLSPPLLQDSHGSQRHPLSASRWAQSPGQLADWLRQLDRDSSPLELWLARSPNRRLGLYYEKLWQYALGAAPGVELLAANLPIRQDGHTLGELDLLIRDAEGDHHLELAIKLYLGPSQASGLEPANWLGPGSHDRLDLKLARLHAHQLPMSGRPQASALLSALQIDHVQAELWLGGYLFYPWPAGCAAARGAHPEHLRGRWLHRCNWPSFSQQTPAGRWAVMPRQAWLAPARMHEADSWTLAQVEQWLAQLEPQAPPVLLVRLEEQARNDWHEAERLFLVADQWPSYHPGPGAIEK